MRQLAGAEWLGAELLGNPLREWLVAVGIAAGAFLILHLFNVFLLRRVLRHAATTPTPVDDFAAPPLRPPRPLPPAGPPPPPVDDFAAALLRRTRRFLVLVLVVWLGSLSLDVPGGIEKLLRTAALFAFLLQLALWALTAIGFWVDRMRRQRMAG